MKVNIKSSNIKITEGIESYIKAKNKAFERPIVSFLAEEMSPIEERKGRVESYWEIGTQSSGKKKGLFFCKLQIVIPGRDRHVKAEAVSGDLYEAIDEIKDIATAQIVALKEKPMALRKRAARKLKRVFHFGEKRGGRVRDEG